MDPQAYHLSQCRCEIHFQIIFFDDHKVIGSHQEHVCGKEDTGIEQEREKPIPIAP